MRIPKAIADDLNGIKAFSYSELSEEESQDAERWRNQILELIPPTTIHTWITLLSLLGYDLQEVEETRSKHEQLCSDLESCLTLNQLSNLIKNNVRFHQR